MKFLTPLAALVALAALAPLGAALFARIRVRAARRELNLEAPSRWSGAGRLGCGIAGIVLLGLAAAQPALTHTESVRERTDAAVLFVIDTSRSMAASATPNSPTRLERAVAAAVKLRSSIPDVPAGVATLTDRVLPDLFPVSDIGSFDGVARRSVGIEDPPPSGTSVVATSYGALREVASGNYFDPGVTRRIVVLLSDGESNPVDPNQVASGLARSHGYRFLALRFWNANERVYDSNGRAESGYQPNPAGASIISGLARAQGGRSFSETQTGAAASYLRSVVGTGPSVKSGAIPSRQTLAPFVAGLAALLLLAAVTPPSVRVRLRTLGHLRSAPSVSGSQGTASRDVTAV